MNKFTMVIPTYWGETTFIDDNIIFDHPTLLDQTGTLARLLESLSIFESFDGTVVVISVANEVDNDALSHKVEQKVDSIITPYQGRYHIINLAKSGLDKITKRLSDKGVNSEALSLLNLHNYAAVRNICSLAGVLYGSDYAIFIDDDEVFTDPGFLAKIAENVRRQVQGETVLALAGYYLQPDTYLLDDKNVPAWRTPYWNNAAAMNEAFRKIIGAEPRLKPTPFVFGGNMTICRQVLKKVPFDPRITRGEDIDFLLNLRIQGINFYLDRLLAIKHLPPKSNQPPWRKVKEDAKRFLYDRKKLRDHEQLDLQQLMPYPGRFLDNDLEERVIRTCELLKQDYLSQNDEKSALECEKIIDMVHDDYWQNFNTHGWLIKLCDLWQEVTWAAEGMGIE